MKLTQDHFISKWEKKHQQQNGKLKPSSVIIWDTGGLWCIPSWYGASHADYLQGSRLN